MQEIYKRLDKPYRDLERLEQKVNASQIDFEAFKEIKEVIKLTRHLSSHYYKILDKYVLNVMEKIEKEQILKIK